MLVASMTLSNHLVLCRPLLLLPSHFPTSRAFPRSLLFSGDGQSIGVSGSGSALPGSTQGWNKIYLFILFIPRLSGLLAHSRRSCVQEILLLAKGRWFCTSGVRRKWGCFSRYNVISMTLRSLLPKCNSRFPIPSCTIYYIAEEYEQCGRRVLCIRGCSKKEPFCPSLITKVERDFSHFFK